MVYNPMSGYCEMKNDYSMMVNDLYSLDFRSFPRDLGPML
jgi:hypothetical protein